MRRAAILAALLLAAAPVQAQPTDPAVKARIDRILKATPLIDGHNDIAEQLRENHDSSVANLASGTGQWPDHPLMTDIARLRAGRVGAQFWSVYIDASVHGDAAIRQTLEQIDLVDRMVAAYPNDLELARTADDIVRIHKAGKIASLIGVEGGHQIGPDTVGAVLAALDQAEDVREVFEDVVWRHRGKNITPKTVNQKRYVDAIRARTVTFGIGPAGTGKTYLAMAQAVAALQGKRVSRIVLTRPAVEAGERLGFLPGSLSEKIDPYLRPLYDALHDMVDPESIPKLIEAGTIEVAPLAYMRGRTLNDAFIILDEAQNTTREQMKMFLTRFGQNSRMIVCGDPRQVDIPGGDRMSGLADAVDKLEGVEGIAVSRFTAAQLDIVQAEQTSGQTVEQRLVLAQLAGVGRSDQQVHCCSPHPLSPSPRWRRGKWLVS